MKVFAINNPDIEVRRNSSAGGAFSLLADIVLSKGGIVYGVAFDNEWNIIHKRIVKKDELNLLRGSKYAYSEAGKIFQDVKNDLEEGRKVLFSGTPCQVAGLSKLIGNNNNLLLVEVVCHGAPKHEYWKKYLEEICKINKKGISDIRNINFRDKRTGWKQYSFTIMYKDGKEFSEKHDENLYMRGFLQNYLLREACFKCPFKYPDGSRADITIGDFWGISKVAPEIDNDLGTSICIARTDKGNTFLEELGSHKKCQFYDIVKFNRAIISSPIKPKNLENFKESDIPIIVALGQYTQCWNMSILGRMKRFFKLFKKWY